MTKEQIRIDMKRKRSALSIVEHREGSRLLHKQLFEIEAYRHCGSLLTYVSFGDEADTRELILRAFADHKKVYVPRVDKKEMEFYEIHSLDGLILSKFGILEPEPDSNGMFPAPAATQNHTGDNLMILPGLAFDFSGNRIGYGGGYYDRYLSSYADTRFVKIAIAFDFQLRDHIPAEESDVKVDYIITPARVLSLRPGR